MRAFWAIVGAAIGLSVWVATTDYDAQEFSGAGYSCELEIADPLQTCTMVTSHDCE